MDPDIKRFKNGLIPLDIGSREMAFLESRRCSITIAAGLSLILTLATIVGAPVAIRDANALNSTAMLPSNPQLKDKQGEPLICAIVGNEAKLSVTISNNLDDDMSATTIIEVRNASGVTEILYLENFEIGKKDDHLASAFWTPAADGTYEIRTFAITGFTSPEVLSPVATSEFGAAKFSLKLTNTTGFETVSEVEVYDISTHIANAYRERAEPYQQIEYARIEFQMEFSGGVYHNNRDSILLASNATVKIRDVDAYETYTLRTGYNSVDKLFDTIIAHDRIYLPEEIKADAIRSARADPLAKQFYESFSDETNSTVILSAAGYLDSAEVYETKYTTTYGGEIVERPEFSFLPNSTQALLVSFQRVPRSVLENPEGSGTVESPSVNVYLEPNSYAILGSVKYFW